MLSASGDNILAIIYAGSTTSQYDMERSLEANYCWRKLAIEEALDVLGQPAKRTILSHLYHNKITIGTDYCSPIEDIQEALKELFGSSVALIMHLIEAIESR